MKTRRPDGGRALRSRRPRGEGGFTLVEVMIAMAIIALAAVVLLGQRLAVVRDAARARDLRTAWVLASQKMADLDLDKSLWSGEGAQSNGDFAEIDPAYGDFLWDYVIVREPIDISDPLEAPKPDQKPKQLLRLTLTVRAPSLDDPIIIEGEFPIVDPKAAAPSQPSTSGDTTQPPSATPSPAPAGGPKR